MEIAIINFKDIAKQKNIRLDAAYWINKKKVENQEWYNERNFKICGAMKTRLNNYEIRKNYIDKVGKQLLDYQKKGYLILDKDGE